MGLIFSVHCIFISSYTVCDAAKRLQEKQVLSSRKVLLPLGRRFRDIVKEKYPRNVYIGAHMKYQFWGKGEDFLLRKEFGYISPGWDFKQGRIHPRPRIWRYGRTDRWVAYAKENGQVIRGSVSISPQASRWAKKDFRTARELKKNLSEFMIYVCKKYNDEKAVRWLDVVNEAIDKQGGWFGPKEGFLKWENPWTKIGYEKNIPSRFKTLHRDGVPLYIIQAFQIANQYATKKKLLINQHGNLEEVSLEKLKELVHYLRSRGLRVDGIGWQAHLKEKSSWWEWADKDGEYLKKLSSLIDWAHKNKLEFHITEHNIQIMNDVELDEDTIASVYANIVRTLLQKRKTGVVAWNLWDITDKPHHRVPGLINIGLWKKDYTPRKAYYSVQKVLERGRE